FGLSFGADAPTGAPKKAPPSATTTNAPSAAQSLQACGPLTAASPTTTAVPPTKPTVPVRDRMRNAAAFVWVGVVSATTGRLTTPAGETACAAARCDTAPTTMSATKEGFMFL